MGNNHANIPDAHALGQVSFLFPKHTKIQLVTISSLVLCGYRHRLIFCIIR